VVAIGFQPAENRRVPPPTGHSMSEPNFRPARNKLVARPHPARVQNAQCNRIDLWHEDVPVAPGAGARSTAFVVANDKCRKRIKSEFLAEIHDDLT
jgi:hypothetical protein